MILFETIVCDGMRLVGSGGTGAPRGCVIHFGKVLEMPRPVKWLGHTPSFFNRNITKQANFSERGQRLGVSLIRQGVNVTFDVSNLDEAWMRSEFDLFIQNSLRYGYFVSWRPDQFPDEVVYGWTDEPIIPTNTQGGVNRKMSVSWSMQCHVNENVTPWESE
jgi:hypothetical protein